MRIRKAVSRDYSRILKIREPILSEAKLPKKTLLDMQQSGFLIGQYARKDFNRDLSELFLIAEEKKKIVGYIVISKIKQYIDNENKKWVDTKFHPIYYSDRSVELHVIFVSAKARQSGVGQKLLDRAIKKLNGKYHYLFSIVTVGPIVNHPSLRFHLKNDFKVAALGKAQELFGIKDYQSILLIKKL